MDYAKPEKPRSGKNYDNSLPAHQMVGGPKAGEPRQGMVPNKVQEDRKPTVCHHAEEVHVPAYKFEGRGNKIV